MNWQEYQEAVARLYEQAEGIGELCRNVYIPDKVTGQPRQIDVLVEVKAKGCTLLILIDAKFHESKLDVKDIEEVIALSNAVGANKTVIVAPNGWSAPAKIKAKFSNVDLRLLSIDDALGLIVENKWKLCPICERDCIVLEHEKAIVIDGMASIFMAGQCRECRSACVWCWNCGAEACLTINSSYVCDCGHEWHCTHEGVQVRLGDESEAIIF